MILKELNLISFGKFENKRIHLDEGLNILYGENESGKTTLHNFIDGMFYGFLKPYARRRNYFEELEKYRPWNKQEYSGILKLSQDGKNYRIERDFDKGQVKVYDELTGIDITEEIDKGERLKDHLPGIHFFNFNNMVYNNTISIKQLESKIDSDLSKEVKDRLANISTSLDDDISVKNAINDLDKKLDSIGSKNAYTKPYGRAIVDLDKLIADRKILLEKKEEYDKQVAESFGLKEKIEKEQEKLEELNNKLELIEIINMKKLYEDGKNIKFQLQEIDKEILDLKEYANLSFEDYALAVKLERDIEYISNEIQELKNNLNKTEESLKTRAADLDENIIDGIDVIELYKDVDTFDEMEEEKNSIIINRQQNRLDILNSELKDKAGKESLFKGSMIILLLMTIASLGLIFVNKLFGIFSVVFGILTFISKNSRKKLISEIKSLKTNIKDTEEKENAKNERLIYVENFQKEILLKYNCFSKLELKRLKDDIYFKDRDYRIRKDEIKKLKQDKENSILTLEAKKNTINELKHELQGIRRKNNSNSLEDFKLGLDKKKRYEELIKEKENKAQILERILGNNTLEEIKEEINSFNGVNLMEIDEIDRDGLLQSIENKKSILQNYLDINARLEERIDNLNKDVKQIITIEEEIDRFKTVIKDYENQIRSINIAKETIENISKEIHHQFAPTINKDVSGIINIISNGRYKEVKIDEGLNISIENPITKEIISVDSLSGGTIDQLYFALRFSIVSSMKGESLPLILDDCFIQYDDERLKNILGYLSKISVKKQIILFTCHHREIELLDDLGLRYNLINLS